MMWGRMLICMMTVVHAQQQMIRVKPSARLDAQGNPKVVQPAGTRRVSDQELKERMEASSGGFARVLSPASSEGRDFKLLKSIYDDAILVRVQQYHTILPQGSILYFPSYLNQEVQLGKVEGTEFLDWPEFYQKYQGLFETVEVSPEQIHDEEGFSEEAIALGRSLQRILVSVYKSNPVTCKAAYLLPQQE